MWAPSLLKTLSRTILRRGLPRGLEGRWTSAANVSIAPPPASSEEGDSDATKSETTKKAKDHLQRAGNWDASPKPKPRSGPPLGSSSDLGAAAPCAPLFMRTSLKKNVNAKGTKYSHQSTFERKIFSSATTVAETPKLRIPHTKEDAPQTRPFSHHPTPPPSSGDGKGRQRQLPPWASWPPYVPPDPPDPAEQEAKSKRFSSVKPRGERRWWDDLRQHEDPLKGLTRPAPQTLRPQTDSSTLKACIVGSGVASGMLALHLALCGRLARLSIVDVDDGKGRAFTLAEDLQRVPSSCLVEAFGSLRQALQGAHLVVVSCGAQLLAITHDDTALRVNAPVVHAVCSAARSVCSQAVVCILSHPVAACTALAFQWMGGDGSAAKRTLGVIAMETARATRALEARVGSCPEVPLVGGAGTSRAVPLISRATKAMHQGEIRWMTSALMTAKMDKPDMNTDDSTTEAAAEAVAANDAVFVERVLAAKQGALNTIVNALVRSNAVAGCDFLSQPVLLGRDGVQKALGLGQLEPFEKRLLRSVLVEHRTQLTMARWELAHVERLTRRRPQVSRKMDDTRKERPVAQPQDRESTREDEIPLAQRSEIHIQVPYTSETHQIHERETQSAQQPFHQRTEIAVHDASHRFKGRNAVKKQPLRNTLTPRRPDVSARPPSSATSPSELAALEDAPPTPN